MIYIYILTVIILPLTLGFLSPTGMIYLLAFTGPLLIAADASNAMGFLLGRVDVTSLRLVGSVAGALLVIITSFARSSRFIKIGLPYILFLLFISISLTWSPSVLYGLRTIVKLAALFLLMVAVGVTIDSEKKLNTFLNITTTSCLLTALIAIFCHLNGINGDPNYLTIPGMSPAVFSANMLVGIIISINREYSSTKKKILLVVFFIAVIIAANTRITITAMFITLSVFGFLKMRGVFRAVFPVTCISAFLILFLMVDKFKNRMFLGNMSVSLNSQQGIDHAMSHLAGSGRFAAWDQVLDRYFYPNILAGSGIGTTQNHFYSSNLKIGAIHSEYVRLLAETGLIGIALFLFSIFICILNIGKNMKQAKSHNSTYLMGICAAFAYLTFMATDNAFDYVNQLGFYVFGLIGIAIAFPVMSAQSMPTGTRV